MTSSSKNLNPKFEVLTAVFNGNLVFWYVTLCRWLAEIIDRQT